MLAISAWMTFVQIAFLFFIVGLYVAIAWMVISETRLRIYRYQRNRRTIIPARYTTTDLPPVVVRTRALGRGWTLVDGPQMDGSCIITKDDAIVRVAASALSGESTMTDLAFLGASVPRDRSGEVAAAITSLLGPDPTKGSGVTSN